MEIKWFEWGKEAFDKAKNENKPILLDIYGLWCHWCHVMDETTYSDEDVIELVNENFIPIRVDTDKRPDINERYNQGGWPTTCFLTSEGKIITGATYVPANDMKNLLSKIIPVYNKIKDDINSHEIKIQPVRNIGDVNESAVKVISERIIENFDAVNGGFGHGQKFPMEDTVNLCLMLDKILNVSENTFQKIVSSDSRNFSENTFQKIALKTLDEMIKLSDPVEGGFFRYSMTSDWKNPHYEKMLESNAKIIINYLYAYQLTQKEAYKKIIEKTIEYIKNNLMNEEGGFYGSQDAGEEDQYYGKTIEERQKLKKPRIDKTIYVNFSSMMIYSLFKSYVIMDKEEYKDIALKSLDFLINNCKNEGMYHYFDGKPHLDNISSDQIWMIKCLIEAYQITGNYKFIKMAEELSEFLISKFYDGSGFTDISESESLGYLKIKNKLIFDNSIASENFLTLSYILNNPKYKEIAEKCLSYFAEEYKRYGIHASAYAIAIEKFLNHETLHVVGDNDFINKNRLETLKIPNMRLIPIFINNDSEIAKELNYTEDNTFYLCVNNTCKRFKTIEEVKNSIK